MPTSHFKLEDHKTVIRLIEKDCFMATLDLKDAYFLIPIWKHHRKYLRFSFNGYIYQYNVMPFGLNIAPFVFTKIMKPLLSHLRQRGYWSVLYLDDFLLLGRSYQECRNNITATINILQSLGFVINFEKSRLVPSHKIQYLGFVYDSYAMTVSIPTEKQLKLQKLVLKFSKAKKCKIRDFARFIGNIISVCPAVRYGYVYTKLFERQKFLALQKSEGNYNQIMNLADSLSADFKWWQIILPVAQNSIKLENFAMEIFSDASCSGWGIFYNGQKSRGLWSDDEKHFHINYLELLATFFALKCFASTVKNCNILCRIDNTTAIAYINRMGSIQFPELNRLSREIWMWCEHRNIFLFASYIKSSENTIADEQSRILEIETEWELNDSSFQVIQKKFGTPDIDLFASRVNTKCKHFVSWLRDPYCYRVDAFTLNWKDLFFYAFPPFCLILKVLQKIICDEARGIIVVPLWTAQPWFPIFSSLIEGKPIVFNSNRNLLSFNRTPHPLWKSLSLVAAVLSYKPYKRVEFHKNP